ncbi:MAG: FAD-dependent oxidoreductase [Polyangiaceae bacterium]
MLDWLVIGGGVHGTHLTLHLMRRGRVPQDRIRILDPHAVPLARWTSCTKNCGMGFLRSPFVHHIDLPADSLMHFTDKGIGKALKSFIDPFYRPSTPLFYAHSDHVIRKNKIEEMRIIGRAEGLSEIEGGYRVETAQGSIEARKILLAISPMDSPLWPEWALALKQSGAPIDHVFAMDFDRQKMPDFESAVVIGGGITGAQLTMALAKRRPGNVTLVTPHVPRVHRFDSNSGWMGPRNMQRFCTETDYCNRRAIIRQARHKGSMPAEVRGTLRRAAELGKLTVKVTMVTNGSFDGREMILDCEDGTTLRASRVVLSTGFEQKRPGGAWLDRAIEEMGLPVSACGFPIVDPKLRWHGGIHCTGALAELELGPPARNIVGARHAAERIQA